MKGCILILSHLPESDMMFHYNWHKRICDTKVIWQTDKKSDDPNIYTIDVPGNIMIFNVMRILCHYAVKFDYDYYCLMAGDCYITKRDFFQKTTDYMDRKDADISFTHLSTKEESYKNMFNGIIEWKYKVSHALVKWSLNICNIVTRECAEIYNRESYFRIYDESDMYAALYHHVKIVGNPFVNYNVFYAGDLSRFSTNSLKIRFNSAEGYDKFLVYEIDEHFYDRFNKENKNMFKNIHIIHSIKSPGKLKELGVTLK